MRYRLKGVSGLGFGASWEKTPSDKDVATQAIRFFEDRRLLYGVRIREDYQYCIASALESREFLTRQLSAVTIGDGLASSLRAMRTAMRRFVDQGGPDGQYFRDQISWAIDKFGLALGELRGTVCLHLANLAYQYDIAVEEDLAKVLPRPDDDDASWLPGFTE